MPRWNSTPNICKAVCSSASFAHLREKLLESNLIRIIKPYSCVGLKIDFVAAKMEIDVVFTERKLSQMILDSERSGILEQDMG